MDTDCKRRQVTLDQLTALLEFLKEHQELAKGLARGRRGKFHTLKSWHMCAKKLNAIKDGAVKDAKGWSKYWCDWKYRVRRRALELKAAKDSNKPPPDGVLPLSSMEENILSIIGANALDAVVIKRDPLGDGDSDENHQDNDDHEESLDQDYVVQFRPRKVKKRRVSKDDISDLENRAGPSNAIGRPHSAVENNVHFDDIDREDEASEFLRLEREKLEINKQMADSLQTMRSEITRLADIMGHIRDMIASNRINL